MKTIFTSLFIRPYDEGDLQSVVSLFYDTIHSVNLKDYTPEQADAWAPKKPDLSRWQGLLKGEDTWVAVQDGRIVGFANRDGEYFDCLYVLRPQGLPAPRRRQSPGGTHRRARRRRRPCEDPHQRLPDGPAVF